MPLIKPSAGGTPDAMAMPMHKGKATRKTTTDASRSLEKVELFMKPFRSGELYKATATVRRQNARLGLGSRFAADRLEFR